MILSSIIKNEDKKSKAEKLKKEIARWHHDYVKIKSREEELIKRLKEFDISERVAILFNLWAEDDNYGKMMKKHTEAISILFEKEREFFIPSYVLANNKNKKEPLVIFEPFVGNGDVTSLFVSNLAKYYYEKTKKKLDVLLYINDIAENMMKIAQKRLQKLGNTPYVAKIEISSTIIDFLDDEARKNALKIAPESVDVTLVSQVLDVIRGIEAKNKVLTLLYDYLKIGGRMVVVGEDPARFSLKDETDPFIALLFQTIFDPFGKSETENEIKRIRDGRLIIIGENSTPIDDSHSAFIRIAEKIYRPSEKKNEV